MWDDDFDHDGMMNGAGYGGLWVMLLLMVLLVLALALTIFLALRVSGPRQSDSPRSQGPAPGSARDVLDQRLARGEITEEEYRATRSLLGP
jgi:putative membrane protein